jgi:2-octaprenyl-6-methoxyphenol hydroxylase
VNHYDVLIVGGGLVGGSVACALAAQSLRVGLIEASASPAHAPSGLDARSVALSYGSYRIFEKMGIWTGMHDAAEPISQIHISDRRHFGFTRIRASEEKVPALGYVIEMHALSIALNAAVKKSGVDVMSPLKVQTMTPTNGAWVLGLNNGDTVSAPLIIAADGTDSTLRKINNIPVTVHDYAQTAIVTNVALKRDHTGIAYERFTETGPLALLPLTAKSCALVWTVQSEQLAEYANLDDASFLARLQQQFGYRLGRFTEVGRRQSYPLKSVSAKPSQLPGFVLLGNAAQTLHPIAGQGFNLGLRDVAALAQQVSVTLGQGRSLNDVAFIQAYYEARKPDQQQLIAMTDGLVRLFSNDAWPCVIPRNLGLLATDLLPPLKRRLALRSMGLRAASTFL